VIIDTHTQHIKVDLTCLDVAVAGHLRTTLVRTTVSQIELIHSESPLFKHILAITFNSNTKSGNYRFELLLIVLIITSWITTLVD